MAFHPRTRWSAQKRQKPLGADALQNKSRAEKPPSPSGELPDTVASWVEYHPSEVGHDTDTRRAEDRHVDRRRPVPVLDQCSRDYPIINIYSSDDSNT